MSRKMKAGDEREFIFTGEIRRYRHTLRVLLAGISIGVVCGALGMHLFMRLRPAAAVPQPSDRVPFTHRQLSEMMGAITDDGEFALLRFMRERNGRDADTSGILGVYREIQAANDRSMKVEEGLEKVYYLSVHRAENAARRGDMADAIRNYRLAEKIKPQGREVAEGLLLTRTEFSRYKKQELPPERTNESVFRVIRSRMSAVKKLYDHVRKTDPAVRGKITMSFAIAPSGRVIRSSVVSSTVNSPELERQLLASFRTWDFGRVSSGAGTLELNYPFVFY